MRKVLKVYLLIAGTIFRMCWRLRFLNTIVGRLARRLSHLMVNLLPSLVQSFSQLLGKKIGKRRELLSCFLILALPSLEFLSLLLGFFLFLLSRLSLRGWSWCQNILDGTTLITDVAVAGLSQKIPDISGGRKRTDSLDILCEEANDSLKHGSDSPGRVPLLRMVLCDSEAYFGVDLKSSIFVHEHNVWWFEGILVGQQNLSVVESLMELSIDGSSESEMPGVNIIRKRASSHVFRLIVVQLFDLC